MKLSGTASFAVADLVVVINPPAKSLQAKQFVG